MSINTTEQNKQWLLSNVNAILEPMMQALVKAKPAKTTDFMLQYLEESFGEKATNGAFQLSAKMKAEIAQLEQRIKDQGKKESKSEKASA